MTSVRLKEIEATIPTVQYGNIKPVVEIEGDYTDEARDQALQILKQVSDMTAGQGYQFDVRGLPVSAGRTTLVTEPELIEYTSRLLGRTTKVRERNGHRYIPGYTGGSSFPNKFYPPFDSEMILNALVEKFGINPIEVTAMWKKNNEASTGYGTAIHAALENYDLNRQLGHKIRSSKETKKDGITYSPNKALSKNPFLKAMVEWFQETVNEKDDVQIFTEEFIWDDGERTCGSVDRIKVIDWDKKIIRIQDYKTDGNIHEKKYQIKDSPFKAEMGNTLLDLHWLQLSFYARIFLRAGWMVEGLDVFWANPEKLIKGKNPWEVYSNEVIDIEKGM